MDPLNARVADEIREHGFCFLPHVAPGLSPLEAFGCLGRIDVLDGFEPVQMLTPRDTDRATPNTYSGNFGTGEFPLHTDLAHWATPPRFIALRCQTGSGSVATSVLDFQAVMPRLMPAELRAVLVQPRRPTGNAKHLLRLYERPVGSTTDRIRWDAVFIQPSNEYASSVVVRVKRAVEASEPKRVLLRETGDTLLLDNWRVMHGRSRVPLEARKRCIARAYFSALNDV